MPALTIFGNPPRATQRDLLNRRAPASVGVERVKAEAKAQRIARQMNLQPGDVVRTAGSTRRWVVTGYLRRSPMPFVNLISADGKFTASAAVSSLTVLSRAAAKNPPKGKRGASSILSRRAIALSYKHAEVGGAAYQHEFASGVTVELLSDGSVRLFRPDGLPLFKFFKRK